MLSGALAERGSAATSAALHPSACPHRPWTGAPQMPPCRTSAPAVHRLSSPTLFSLRQCILSVRFVNVVMVVCHVCRATAFRAEGAGVRPIAKRKTEKSRSLGPASSSAAVFVATQAMRHLRRARIRQAEGSGLVYLSFNTFTLSFTHSFSRASWAAVPRCPPAVFVVSLSVTVFFLLFVNHSSLGPPRVYIRSGSRTPRG